MAAVPPALARACSSTCPRPLAVAASLAALTLLAGCGGSSAATQTSSQAAATGSGTTAASAGATTPAATSGTAATTPGDTGAAGTAAAGGGANAGGNGGPTVAAGVANGVQKLAPADALAKAEAALLHAPSVQLTASSGGSAAGAGGSYTVASRIRGTQGRGTVSIGGMKLDVLSLGSSVYLLADSKFWLSAGHASSAAAAKLAGKYVRMPATAPAAQGVSLWVDGSKVAAQMLGSAKATSAKLATLNGKPVYAVTNSDGMTIDLALTGQPYPLQITGQGVKVTFGYGVPVDLTPPPAASVIELSSVKLS